MGPLAEDEERPEGSEVAFVHGFADQAAQVHRPALARRIPRPGRPAGPVLREAAEIEPQNIHIRLSLGWCYKRCRRLDLAIQALEEALEADASHAIIHYNLACYWSLAGNVKLAVAYLAQAFDLEPEYRDLVQDERDFDPIRNHPHFQALTAVIV